MQTPTRCTKKPHPTTESDWLMIVTRMNWKYYGGYVHVKRMEKRGEGERGPKINLILIFGQSIICAEHLMSMSR